MCGDEGAAPITLLTLDCSHFERAPPDSVEEQLDQPSATLSEEAEALAAQQTELESLKQGSLSSDSQDPDGPTPRSDRPTSASVSAAAAKKAQQYKEEYVFLSVLIHADMVSKPPATEGSAEESGAAAGGGDKRPESAKQTMAAAAGGGGMSSLMAVTNALQGEC